MASFYDEIERSLATITSQSLSLSDDVDALLLANVLADRRRGLQRLAKRRSEVATVFPFLERLAEIIERWRDHEPVDPEGAAGALSAATKQMTALLNVPADEMQSGLHGCHHAPRWLDEILVLLTEWHMFYSEYDPDFHWWLAQPYPEFAEKARACTQKLMSLNGTAGERDNIPGVPIGRDELLAELISAMLPYSPEELIAIAEREREWCKKDLLVASRELGFADDWRAAIEYVKSLCEPPGGQPSLVRDLAVEAIEFVTQRDIVTIPPLSRECWRTKMISAEAQKVSPFFLGGEMIHISFPTSGMDHDTKRMSRRGNNRYFSRATVQHELIPGHHLQLFSMERNRPYRKAFRTAFWIEGWTLHWEMLLWDFGFAQSPEDRVGMLFWRLHRCVRVLFSLGFHLGTLDTGQCVKMLVEEVGHEPANAAAEVRRSFNGDYEPLYQASYLIGGLQVRALYQELVENGVLTPRQFHDRFLQENCMPIAALRALMLGQRPDPDTIGQWRFDRVEETEDSK